MTRTRWAGRLAGGLLAFAGANGCKQQLFLEPSDYAEAAKAGPAAFLETRPDAAVNPLLPPGAAAPATVLDPTRPPRPLTLPEAIAIALENGGIGAFPGANPGFGSEQLPQFTGRGTQGSDAIKAFALDPAVAAAEIERALSKFDARWINSMTWNKVDQPVLSLQQSFANGDTAQLSSTLAKPLPTGGVAGITFATNYQRLSTPPLNNQFVALTTSYSPSVQFSFEQPLLQGFGVEINQLLPNHPGTQLIQGLRPSGGQGSEGILITRIRLDQQRASFDASLNQLLFNVEAAYWNLVSRYYNLLAQEEGLKQSLDSFLYYKARTERGLNREQVSLQALAQYFNFHQQVVQARGQVLEGERQLRLLLNLRSDDGTRLVPVDDLIQAPYVPDAQAVIAEAVASRPDLLVQRQEVKARQLNVLLQKNLRRPDLRFLSSYNVAGLGEKLDGDNDPTNPNRNALASLASNQFNSWTLGIRLDMPLGFRDANALVRQAELQLQQEVIRLYNAEVKAEETITRQIRQVIETHQRAELFRMQRKTQERFVKLDQDIRNVGAIGKEEAASFVINLIQSQQQLANSTAQEYALLAEYNIALAGLEWAKGTIQQYNRITVADGPLPATAGKKAADHFAMRDAALKLREHPADGPLPPPFVRTPMSDAQIQAGQQTILNEMRADGIAPPALPGLTQPAPGTIKPMQPTPQAPAPQPTAPAGRPVSVPLPPVGTGRPQLVPTDAPPAGTFSPVGSLTLPARPAAAVPATVPVIASPAPPK
jgi:outer membrane protein TolC